MTYNNSFNKQKISKNKRELINRNKFNPRNNRNYKFYRKRCKKFNNLNNKKQRKEDSQSLSVRPTEFK